MLNEQIVSVLGLAVGGVLGRVGGYRVPTGRAG